MKSYREQNTINNGSSYRKRKTKIIIVVFTVFLVVTLFIFTTNKTETNQENKPIVTKIKEKINSSKDPLDLRYSWSRGKCEGEGVVKFGTLPMKPEDFSSYIPYGLIIDSHVTPIDHGYFSPRDRMSARDSYEVRAIADGTIVKIGVRNWQVNEVNNNKPQKPDYRLDIEHTCTLYSYFDLITSLAPEIKTALDKAGGQYFDGRIPIKEGQLLGWIGGQTLDFAVYNNEVKLGFINPLSYTREAWKIHTDDPFKYFKEPARSILLDRNVRKHEPLSGKIDYDIEGKLVGNWFKEGTDGYNGTNKERYWDGHLAIVYDYLEPSQIRFSIGNFNGVSKQFGVKINAPDPATIDINSGIIKYDLVMYEYTDRTTGKGWDGSTKDPVVKNMNSIEGCALMQVLDNNKLKVEVFPEKTTDQITVFTDKAAIYVR